MFKDWEVVAFGLAHRDVEEPFGFGWGECDECLVRVVSSWCGVCVGCFGWLCGLGELFASIRPSHPPAGRGNKPPDTGADWEGRIFW